jgi:sporulation protein YlmC with PRC-barrel domain
MVGASVRDRDGRTGGEITDLSLDKNTGRVNYAIVSFGRFLGLRSRFHPIPLRLLRYDAASEEYTISLTMSEVDKAPSLTLAELEELIVGEKAWRDRLASYYNHLPTMTSF